MGRMGWKQATVSGCQSLPFPGLSRHRTTKNTTTPSAAGDGGRPISVQHAHASMLHPTCGLLPSYLWLGRACSRTPRSSRPSARASAQALSRCGPSSTPTWTSSSGFLPAPATQTEGGQTEDRDGLCLALGSRPRGREMRVRCSYEAFFFYDAGKNDEKFHTPSARRGCVGTARAEQLVLSTRNNRLELGRQTSGIRKQKRRAHRAQRGDHGTREVCQEMGLPESIQQ